MVANVKILTHVFSLFTVKIKLISSHVSRYDFSVVGKILVFYLLTFPRHTLHQKESGKGGSGLQGANTSSKRKVYAQRMQLSPRAHGIWTHALISLLLATGNTNPLCC